MDHPNWVALATVKFKPKIFVKSTGTEDEITKKEKSVPDRVEIDETARLAYEEVLKMPLTAETVEKKFTRRRKRVKIEKVEFDKHQLFKLAIDNDPEGIQRLWLKSIKPDVNQTDSFGWTALMMSACEGSVDSFRKLLELGAILTIADKKGNTASSLAQNKGFQSILDVIRDFEEQNQSIEISDDDEDKSNQDGTLFCKDCGIEISVSSSTSHQTSTVHLFSCKFKGNTNIKSFGIARTNLGFQILRRTGEIN